jgi:hypothetical protein
VQISYFETNNLLRQNADALRRGKKDFTIQELSNIKLYLQQYRDCLDTVQFFEGKIKNYQVCSCFAENFESELLEYMIKKKGAAISIVVILSQKTVLFMRNEACTINLCDLAKILCDGECIESTTAIAYGKLNETFLNFTKILTPC